MFTVLSDRPTHRDWPSHSHHQIIHSFHFSVLALVFADSCWSISVSSLYITGLYCAIYTKKIGLCDEWIYYSSIRATQFCMCVRQSHLFVWSESWRITILPGSWSLLCDQKSHLHCMSPTPIPTIPREQSHNYYAVASMPFPQLGERVR